MKAFAICMLVGSALLLSQLHAQETKTIGEEKPVDLAGTYKIVSGERSGVKLSEEKLDNVMVRIATNAITTYTKDKKEIYAATYTLDTSATPWKISMTATITPDKGVGTKTQGLIDIKGDTARLIYALPGGAVPTTFTAGDKQQMFVLRKMPSLK